MGDEDEHELVDNPQRAWLMTARATVNPAVESLRSCLTAGQDALTAGAWTGTRASAWGQEFGGRRHDLRSGAERVRDDLDDAIARAPRQVCRCQLSSLAINTPFPTFVPAAYPSVAAECTQ